MGRDTGASGTMARVKSCSPIIVDVPRHQRRVLWIVLAINAAMFVLELGAGIVAHSTALIADSVDMLGDALVYGFSLYVVGRGPLWHARGALLKGSVMAALGAGVLVEAAVKLARGLVPAAETMGVVALLALAANAACLVLLGRCRGDDLNMRSAWLCSRNDVLANGAVLVAAGGVALTDSAWPDVVVGLLLALVVGHSALEILRAARRQLRLAPGR